MPSPMVRAAVAPTPDQVAAAGAAAILAQETAQYSEKWGGRAQIAGRGTCTFSLEIKTQPNTAKPFCRILQPSLHRHHFSRWYEDGPCGHSHPDRGKGGTIIDPALRQRVTNGSIAYLTDKVVSRDYKKCDMESMDVTPFGSGQLAAQWAMERQRQPRPDELAAPARRCGETI
jgi:hypothetical protein